MKFQIELTDVAEMEFQDTLLWLLGRSPDYAGRRQAGLEKAIQSLEFFPTRCALAPESTSFEVEVRQLIYSGYRVLFTCLDANDDGRRIPSASCTCGTDRAVHWGNSTVTHDQGIDLLICQSC